MKTLIIIYLNFFLWSVPEFSLDVEKFNDPGKIESMYRKAYLELQPDLWLQGIEMARSLSDQNNSHLLQARGYFGLLNTALAKEDRKLFNQHAATAEKLFAELIKLPGSTGSLGMAFQGALYGWKIAFSPVKGMFLGPKSQDILDKACASNSNHPEAMIRKGASLLFSPAVFGGDINKAIEYYRKGIVAYEKVDNTGNWLYLDALAWLGQAYQSAGLPEKSMDVYRKALQVEPEFQWVKQVLLPEAEALISKK
jgi:tetratricopeptide (TPR) repeat protein